MVATSAAANFILDYDVGSFDCYEGSSGFEQCSVEVSIDVRHDGHPRDSRRANVDVECEVELSAEEADGGSSYYSENDDVDVSVRSNSRGSDSIDFDFDVSSYSPTINVRIDSVSCEIVDVS